MDGTPATVIDQVFLTPRVLDARAFTEYSATLRELVGEAAGHQTSLHTVSEEVKALHQGLRDASIELQKQLDVALKVLPGIDARLSKADKLVAEADQALNVEPMERLRAMKLESSRATFDALQHFQNQMSDALTGAIEQSRLHTDALIARSCELESHALQMASTLEARLQTRLDEFARQVIECNGVLDTQARMYDDRLTRRGEELEASLQSHAAAVEQRIDSKLGQLESRIHHFNKMLEETCERQAQAAIGTIMEQASAIERRTNALAADAAVRITELQGALDNKLIQSEQATAKMISSLNSLLANTTPVLENAQVQADGAADRLGVLLATARDFVESEQGGVAIREFRQIAARLDKARDQADSAAHEYNEIRKQADLARTNLGQALLEAASGADQMLARSDEVIARTHQCGDVLKTLIVETARAEQLHEAASTLTARSQTIENAAAHLGKTIEALEARKLHLESDLRRTGELLDLADVSLADRYNQLGTALQRGNELGNDLHAATAQSLSSIESLKREQLAAAQLLQTARAQIEKQIEESLSPLLAQSQNAAERLEGTIQRARSIEVGIPARTGQTAVSASTLFPTAR